MWNLLYSFYSLFYFVPHRQAGSSTLFQDHTANWKEIKEAIESCHQWRFFKLFFVCTRGLLSTAKADLMGLAILKKVETSQWEGSAYHPLMPPPSSRFADLHHFQLTVVTVTTADSGHTINSLRSSVSPGQPSWRKFAQRILWNKNCITCAAKSHANHLWPWWPVVDCWNSSSRHMCVTWVWKYP